VDFKDDYGGGQLMVKLRPDWLTHLHLLRKKELDIIFSRCPMKFFNSGLELGSGDGYQSRILINYVSHLTATEYSPEWLLDKHNTEFISYQSCDAEFVDKYFKPKQFDLVFSSNVMEHLPRPELALRGIHNILKDDGVTIHSMPTPFWKLCQVLLFYPHLMLYALERVFEYDYWKRKILRSRAPQGKNQNATVPTNNPKTSRPFNMFVPTPHGAYRTHREEFLKFGKNRWVQEFSRNGFEVVEVRNGSVFSPYGFGWDTIRRFLGRLGIASEYIYIAKKAEMGSRFIAQCSAHGKNTALKETI
jgi:SAM-dependent methyltransferase